MSEVNLEKEQRAAAQHEHMAQGPARQPAEHHRSVFICYKFILTLFIHFKVEKCAYADNKGCGIKHRREKMPKMKQ